MNFIHLSTDNSLYNSRCKLREGIEITATLDNHSRTHHTLSPAQQDLPGSITVPPQGSPSPSPPSSLFSHFFLYIFYHSQKQSPSPVFQGSSGLCLMNLL